MWSQIPRQYRRLVALCAFLGSLSLVYHAGLSVSLACIDKDGRNCDEAKSHKEQHKRPVLADSSERDRDLHVKKNKGFIVRRGIVEDLTLDEQHQDKKRSPMDKIELPARKQGKIVNRTDKLINKKHKTEWKSNFLKSSRLNRLRTPEPAKGTKKPITLSKEIRNHEIRSVYIQIKEADSPRAGDFECDATIVPKCCAISVEDSHEAKHICEGFGKLCKGFVLSTISSREDSFEFVIYLKKELNGTMANYLTDFYIKVDYLDELKWNEIRR